MSDDPKDWLDGFLALGVIMVGVFGYLLPALVAMARRHAKMNAIGGGIVLLGVLAVYVWDGFEMRDRASIDPQILLGGAIVFWVGLLVWAFSPFEKPKKSE